MDIGTLTGQIELEDHLSSGLTIATANVKRFASGFDGMVGTVLVGAGAAAAAITAITVSIIQLGNRGSDINDVANTLEHFAGSAEKAEAIMASMRDGVLGTVTDFELAGTAARLLSANVQLTAEQFGTLSEAAFVLQNRGLGTTKQMMDLVSDAMITGRTRSLALKLGVVEVKDAEADFARSLGTTKDQLSQSGIVEARRIAILKMLGSAVKDAGEQQRDFGEQMTFAVVQIKNWGDQLASQIAKSSAVTGAVAAIGNALKEAFGSSSQTLLQAVVGWVDAFANTVTTSIPTVVRIIGTVKDVVVGIWNELVAFNNRWQITNNLIAAAKFAWGVLETAFNLVKAAVQAVIRAWSAMPDWLQKITRTAIEASVAYAAYSVAIQGVATPFRALVGQFDLGINIIGNLTGAISSSMLIWAKLVPQYHLATAALGKYIVAQRMTVAGSKIEIFMYESVRLAKMTLTAATNALTFAYTTLAARVQMTSAYLVAHAAFVNVVKTAQAAWAIVVGLVSTAYTGLITRLGLATTALRLSTIATAAAKIAMEGLGFVILGIQALPLVAALTGIVLGLNEIRVAFTNLQRAHDQGKTTWEFLTAKDSDTWARRWINYVSQFVAGVDLMVTKTEEARNRLKGGPFTGDLRKMVIDPNAIATGSSEMEAARAERIRLENAQKGIFGLTDQDKPSFLKADDSADKFIKRVRDMQESLKTAGDDVRVFEQVFRSLSKAQLDNIDVQSQLIPLIEQTAEAHGGKLSPAMQQAYTQAINARNAVIATGAARLDMLNVTEDVIKAELELGATEAEIAVSYGVTIGALQKYRTELQKTADHDQKQAALRATETERLIETTKAGQKAVLESRKQLSDAIERESLSTLQFELRNIDRWVEEQQDAFVGTEQQYEDFNANIIALSNRRKRALFVDNEALKQHSLVTLFEQAVKSRETYEEMARHPGLYKPEAIAAFKEIAEEAERNAQRTRNAWNDVWDGLKETLQGIPDLISQAFTGGGGLLGALKALGTQIADSIITPIMKKLKDAKNLGAQLGIGIGSAIAGGVGATVDRTGAALGGLASSIAGAALATTSLGAAAATSTVAAIGLGAATAGVGLAVVGAYVAFKKWFTVSAEVKKMREEVLKFTDALAETLTAQERAEAGGDKWKETVIAVRNAYVLLGKSAADALSDVEALLDTGNIARSSSAAARIAENVAIAQNIKGVRQLVQEYIGAGTKIPESLQRNIDKLVMMKKLTTENATELLKLTHDSVPAYADVTAAAERYGIQVESLGNAVQGLRITEVAQQAVTDWKLLEKAGADMNVVMIGMQDEIQQLITDSIKFGATLPAEMKPIIERMIEAGLLTDELGEKLTDTSRLTFAETLVEKIEKLVDAMLELADAIRDDVGGALDEIGNKVVSPKIAPKYVAPNDDSETRWEPQSMEEPSYFASGKTAGQGGTGGGRGRVIAFMPRGTDRIPAMIGQDEAVLNAAESKAYANATGGTAIIEMDGKEMARIIVPKMRQEVRRYRLARR